MTKEMNDIATASAVITTPVWLQWVEVVLQPFMITGAFVLLVLRLYIAVRDIKKDNTDTAP